ncbi:MAG: metal ABC transporter permease [Burkholderiaceae bacterium]
MIDDFVWRALLAGIGVALLAGPLGCFVIWRRMAYFGDTLAHATLLGIALATMLAIQALPGMIMVALAIGWALLPLQRRALIGSDALLGILSHGSLAVGLVVLSFVPGVRVDLFAYLFGDVLAVDRAGLIMIWLGAAATLALLLHDWRGLFAATVHRELAVAEGLPVKAIERRFVVVLALVIALAIQVVGILMITALLIIPAATARRWAAGPEAMAFIAAAIGIVAVIGGLWGSVRLDTPSGPSIVVAAVLMFIISMGVQRSPRAARDD